MEALGIHLLAEYTHCDPSLINDVSYIEKIMLEGASASGATIISSSFHHFSPYGISGVVVIQESHLAIHTWPEYRYASVDIFTCGETVDPWKAFDYIKKSLKAENGTALKMSRGTNMEASLINGSAGSTQLASHFQVRDKPVKKESWITLRDEETAVSFKYIGEKIFDQIKEKSRIEIFNTTAFGNIFIIDDKLFITEGDEYIYHEMLVHPAAIRFKNKFNALIIGPTLGGSVREILKYQDRVTLSVVDNKLFNDGLKDSFPGLYSNLHSPGIRYYNETIDLFIKEKKIEKYDLIIIDNLYVLNSIFRLQSEVFEFIFSILSETGIAIIPLGSPFSQLEQKKNYIQRLGDYFKIDDLHLYYSDIPSFPTGKFLYMMANKNGRRNRDISGEMLISPENVESNYKYFNLDINNASFIVPERIKMMFINKKIVDKQEKIGSKIDFI